MNQTRRNKSFWEKHFDTEAGFNLSWGAVLAGVVTFFAVFFLFSLITSAIGFGAFNPTQSDPLSGVGTGTMIWTGIALILSLFAGGFVAGLAARRTGLLHGFLVWALSLMITIWMLTSAVTVAVGTLGNTIGAGLGLVGDAAAVGANLAGDAANAAFEQVGQQISGVDTEKLQADMQKVLKDTDKPELQPNYLADQLDQVKDEIAEAAKTVVINPSAMDETLKKLGDDLTARADAIGKAADRDAIASAVAKNSDLNEQEANQAVDNIYNGLQQASAEAKQQIENAKAGLEQAKADFDQKVEELKQGAEDVSNAASGMSIILFFALLIGLCLSAFAGYLGSEKSKVRVLQK